MSARLASAPCCVDAAPRLVSKALALRRVRRDTTVLEEVAALEKGEKEMPRLGADARAGRQGLRQLGGRLPTCGDFVRAFDVSAYDSRQQRDEGDPLPALRQPACDETLPFALGVAHRRRRLVAPPGGSCSHPEHDQ